MWFFTLHFFKISVFFFDEYPLSAFRGVSFGNTTHTHTVSRTSSKFAVSFLLAVVVRAPRTRPSLSVTWRFPLFFNQVLSWSTRSLDSLCTSTASSQRSSVVLKFFFPFGLSGLSITLAAIFKPDFTLILCVSSCLFAEVNNFFEGFCFGESGSKPT